MPTVADVLAQLDPIAVHTMPRAADAGEVEAAEPVESLETPVPFEQLAVDAVRSRNLPALVLLFASGALLYLFGR
jgi:hypothetical protein